MNEDLLDSSSRGYPKTIVKTISEAGLIWEEEEQLIEDYLWSTGFEGVC